MAGNRLMDLETLSRATVLLSALVGIVFEAWLGAFEWPPLLPASAVAFLAVLMLAWKSPAWAWAVSLGSAYLVPVMFQAALGRFLPAYQTIWLAALFAAVIVRPDPLRWRFPPSWKLPLAGWALMIALVWPVVVARETDFRWSTMIVGNAANSGLGGPPNVGAVMILNVALTHILGLLCFDQFFATFPAAGAGRFKRIIVAPLVVSFLLGAGIALYQGLVDISWLSAHAWPAEYRAAGGLVDGDANGALAGFWSSAFFALAPATVSGWLMTVCASVVAWGALWASGSRMALLAGLIGLAFAAGLALWEKHFRAKVLIFVTGAALIAAVMVMGSGSTISPLRRTLDTLPTLSRESLESFVRTELFDRHAPYGSASVMMFRQHPFTGVGVAAYYQMFPDYSYLITGRRAAFENAQSWYRHQLAELGLVGSLGWLWWVMSFAWLLATTHGDDASKVAAGVVKGALVAIAVVSAISMPTQVTSISLTVWVFAFWYITLSASAQDRLRSDRWHSGRIVWPVVWILAGIFAVGTWHVARVSLRPPFRAIAADWRYVRGFYDPEDQPGTGAFRWTSDNAVYVFPTEGRYLKLTIWALHPDIATRPVDVAVWRRDERIVTTTLRSSAPTTWYVSAPIDRRMMLEFDVSRTWKPSDYGEKDPRELGVAVADWTFVDELPSEATVLN